MNKLIDLRSDTVTQPTREMRAAMMNAVVGDDVMKEDPTVKELEHLAAERFEKEAALFVVSGTMANIVAVSTLCSHGDQAIVHTRSHINNLEVGAISSVCGVQPRAIPAPKGVYEITQLEEEIYKADIQRAPTTLVCFENSFDLNQGLAVTPQQTEEAVRLVHAHGLQVYLDGARIFNASVALDIPVAEMCKDMDAVGFCLSKGLGCPIGSLLVGSGDFISRARRKCQRFGGGWRQAGILAAAGIVALHSMVNRLAKDHTNARKLAKGIKKLGLGIDMEQVQTNIVNIDLSPWGMDAQAFSDKLSGMKVKVKPIAPSRVRMVTHKDISAEDINTVLNLLEGIYHSN